MIMNKENFKKNSQGEKDAYIRPEIGYAVLEDPCMVFTSWTPHGSEDTLPVEEEEDDLIPNKPKGAKAFDAWEIDITDNSVDFSVRFNSND